MSDREARRRRTAFRRSLAGWLFGVAAFALLAIGFVAALGLSFTGLGPPIAQCGALLAPVQHPPGLIADVCGAALAEHTTIVLLITAVIVAAVVAGILLLVKNPAKLSF
jgi:hypothetical protein